MAQKRNVTAECPQIQKKATVPFNCPESIEEAVKMWGADVVLSNAIANVVISLQGNIRRRLTGSKDKAGQSADVVAKELATYIPKKASERMDPVERMAAQIGKMSPEKKAAILAMLREKAKA